MQAESSMSLAAIMVVGVVGLLVVAGSFALIYWLLGRGKDDESLS